MSNRAELLRAAARRRSGAVRTSGAQMWRRSGCADVVNFSAHCVKIKCETHSQVAMCWISVAGRALRRGQELRRVDLVVESEAARHSISLFTHPARAEEAPELFASFWFVKFREAHCECRWRFARINLAAPGTGRQRGPTREERLAFWLAFGIQFCGAA